MQTLFLDPGAWDLVLDANRNWAVAAEPYSLAQDAASSIRTFAGEVWYDTTRGTPYFATTLGKTPPLALVKAQAVAASLLVPGIAAAKTFVAAFTKRGIAGQVQITTKGGQVIAANF